ncbi:MAG: tetratricopeptide repeat protein, partial [Nitrosomonadales bacterium]|nr:tetratricopeptide repeat protein [Nitrosomonadales bacterium]
MTLPGRNDPCPCGSGKKYKKCCLGNAASSPSAARQNPLQHHKGGNLSQAERGALEENPVNLEALFMLGKHAYQDGRHEAAAELINRAIRAAPGNPDFHNALGAVNQALKRTDEAVACYRKALALDPAFAEAHRNLGDALREQGRLEEAKTSQQKARELYRAGDCYNAGNALREQGRLDAAIGSYREALAIRPDYAEAHNNLGVALSDLGKRDEAVVCYRKALAIRPGYAEAHNNLGVVLNDLGKHGEAANCYQRALALDPGFAEAHFNLGNALKEQRKLGEAAVNYRKALALRPNYAEAYHNLGYALKDQGKVGEAMESFRRALALKPDFSEAYSSLLFLHAYQAFLDPGDYLALARGWERACVPAEDRQAARFFAAPSAGRRLKIGYVSGDYWNHAISYFAEQLFTHHDRRRVELYAYSNHGQRDAVTERLQSLVEHWVPVFGIPDAALRDRIEADGIDVLVDLSGHTAFNRMGVFARRAAPVQAHYLGFFASTGLS